MINILKKTASGLLEMMLTTSYITAVRAWEPATMYEIDLRIPSSNMEKWDTIKRLKCKVGEFDYRDYTPALWDAESKTCTMFIESGHSGAGSQWVRGLRTGGEIFMGAAHAAPLPSREGAILCLGDGSALGHFLSLKQLTNRDKYAMQVAVHLHDHYEIPSYLLEDHPEFKFIMQPGSNSLVELEKWAGSLNLGMYTSIYIAGNIPMVTGLRKKLKAMPEVRAKVFSHGFWS